MKILVVGMGLIGGSFCKAIKKYTAHHMTVGFRRSDAGNGHRYGKCGRNHSRGPPSPDEARRSHYRSSAASQNRGLYSGEQKQFRPGRHRHRCMQV